MPYWEQARTAGNHPYTGLQQGLGEPPVNHARLEVYGRFNPFSESMTFIHFYKELGKYKVYHSLHGPEAKGENIGQFDFYHEAEDFKQEVCTRIHLRKQVQV